MCEKGITYFKLGTIKSPQSAAQGEKSPTIPCILFLRYLKDIHINLRIEENRFLLGPDISNT